MPPATPPPEELVSRARQIAGELAKLYPDARIELNASNPLQLLVAAILSARSTERNTNAITPGLFARYPSAAGYAAADQDELEQQIQSTGFFRSKARTLIALGQDLCQRYGGDVPAQMDELITLPGVGRKTASMVLGDAFGQPAIVTDTHLVRLAQRLGWSEQTNPDKLEQDVAALLPREDWTAVSSRLIWHGRRVCHARRPACGACAIAGLCPAFGAGPTDEATARQLIKPGPSDNGGSQPARAG